MPSTFVRIIITSDRKNHMLIIESCSVEDSGTYTFKTGKNQSSAKLKVKGNCGDESCIKIFQKFFSFGNTLR